MWNLKDDNQYLELDLESNCNYLGKLLDTQNSTCFSIPNQLLRLDIL